MDTPQRIFIKDFSKYIEEENIVTRTYNKEDRTWDFWIVTPRFLITKETYINNKKIGYFSLNRFVEKNDKK
jgi:prenyltransferase beta subunit